MRFGGLQKLTLLDYPGYVACTLFTVGCNFRCPFCHNSSLVTAVDKVDELTQEDIFAFLRKRRNVLEGICLTGGEPLIQSGVEEFLTAVKKLGYKVKLDTNGAYPDRLQRLIQDGLVDYVAMDVKNSKPLYAATCGCNVNTDDICRSVKILKCGNVDYEFRTTVTATFHTEQSVLDTARWLEGATRWYLQQFKDGGQLLDDTVIGYGDDTLKRFAQLARKFVPETHVRGIN